MSKKRKSGEGLLRKRNDGRWEGRIVIGYNEKGLPITKNVTAKTKQACVEKLNALKESVVKQEKEIPLSDKSTFGEWLDFWVENYASTNLKQTTLAGYENAIYKHIIPSIGDMALDELNEDKFQTFIMDKKLHGRLQYSEIFGEGLSDRSIRLIQFICKNSLEKAVEVGVIHSNPLKDVKLLPKSKAEMLILFKEDLYKFLIQAKYDDFFEIILTALTTGMRRGEVLGLQWDDINFETGEVNISRQVTTVNGKVTISTPKNKQSIRKIIFPRTLLNVLEEYRKTVNSIWVFPSPLNNELPREPTSVYKKTQRILERAGCKKVRFHDLRHTFATNALANGVDLKTLSSMLGHISAETTMNVYLHSTIEMKKNAADKIESKMSINKANTDSSDSDKETTPKEEQNAKFEPMQGKHRKPGTGCISKISENLYEGRYTPKFPNGKRVARNVYAHTLEECEELLAELIVNMKAEIQEEKEKLELMMKQEEIENSENQVLAM